MNKGGWLAFAAVLVIVIAVAFFMAQKGALTTTLQIFNFNFTETQEGPETFTIDRGFEAQPGSGLPIVFSGPIQKPTPCHTLSASSRVDGNDVIVGITAVAGEGFCIQVIADVFYRGSFDYTGAIDEIIVMGPFNEEIARQKL